MVVEIAVRDVWNGGVVSYFAEEEAVEADVPVAESGTEPMVERDSRADPSPSSDGVHARTPMLSDLPQLVSEALSAATPGDVAEDRKSVV